MPSSVKLTRSAVSILKVYTSHINQLVYIYLSNIITVKLTRPHQALLTTVPSLRIGCGAADAEEIKSHPFFDGLSWSAVEAKELEPEFVPSLSDTTKPTDEELELDAFEEKEGLSSTFGSIIGAMES